MRLLRKLAKAGRLPPHDSEGFNGKWRWSMERALAVVDVAEKQKSRDALDRIREKK